MRWVGPQTTVWNAKTSRRRQVGNRIRIRNLPWVPVKVFSGLVVGRKTLIFGREPCVTVKINHACPTTAPRTIDAPFPSKTDRIITAGLSFSAPVAT